VNGFIENVNLHSDMVSNLLGIWDVSEYHLSLWQESFSNPASNLQIPKGGIHIIPPLAPEYLVDLALAESKYAGDFNC